jgi:hypothetical protein
MSSGACRALVAVLLTLVATIVMVLPVAAQDRQIIIDRTRSTYTVDPAKGKIELNIAVVLKPSGRLPKGSTWGPLYVEELATPRIKRPYTEAGSQPLEGPWEAIDIRTPVIKAGDEDDFSVRYTLDASVDLNNNIKSQTPARLDGSYLYFCVTGQDTSSGNVRVNIKNASAWQPVQLGTPMEPTRNGFKSFPADERSPGDIFTCFEAVREDRLAKETLIGPAGRKIELQAWAGLDNWLSTAQAVAPGVLRDLHGFLGYDIPGEGTLIVRMSPSSQIGGYANAHSTPGVVQLDETVTDPEHQLAHAWFGTDNFEDVWLREGLAEWTATAMAGAACEMAEANPPAPFSDLDELDLSDDAWLVVQPQAPENIDQLIAAQEAAACGIVSAAASRMPAEQWSEVIGSMLRGETKYIGSAGPEIGTSTAVDWREWLDAVDERGLVPAAEDPAYAANRDDLDWAQDLLDRFGIPEEIPGFVDELGQRSEARRLYHDFLDDIAPLGAPWAVRQDMDDWDFSTAMARIELSRTVYEQLSEADDLLPEADLIRIVQPQYEAARNEAELDEVARLVEALLEGTRGVVGPLEELNEALPPGWKAPAAVNRAIGEQRFDDIMAAISPALVVAQEVNSAHAALPQAGILQKYRAVFENTTTAAGLEDLVAEARSDAFNAQRAGRGLAELERSAGDWTIPAAVTTPLEEGRLEDGVDIIEDALAIVTAVSEADAALEGAGLREEVKPLFEAVQTGAEMAELREQVAQRAQDARNVGEALSTLSRLAPEWTIPAVLAEPVARGDFAAATASAAAARKWIEFADQARTKLPDIFPLERAEPAFESAESLQDLQQGAATAEDWSEAADWVSRAIEARDRDRDMLTSFGLWGVSVEPVVQDAIDAAVAGDVPLAINKSNEAIQAIEGGAGAGSLRLAGIVFFGVAVLGVLGLWVMLRRQRGPPSTGSSGRPWATAG